MKQYAAVLRGRTATTDVKKQALWSQLADIAETDGVFVDRTLTSYSIETKYGLPDLVLSPLLLPLTLTTRTVTVRT